MWTHNPKRLISISAVGTFNLRINAQSLYVSYSFPNESSPQPLTGYDLMNLQINRSIDLDSNNTTVPTSQQFSKES